MSRLPSNLTPTNRNALRHGLRSGQLPAGCGYVARITRELRQAIEDAVAGRNDGAVSLYHASLINTAIRWERHSLLCQRWLRNEADKLNPDQRLAYSRETARASAERDKCLRLLGLDKSDLEAQIDQLYRQPLPPVPPTSDAAGAEPALGASSAPDPPAGHVRDSGACEASEESHDSQAGQTVIQDSSVPVVEGSDDDAVQS